MPVCRLYSAAYHTIPSAQTKENKRRSRCADSVLRNIPYLHKTPIFVEGYTCTGMETQDEQYEEVSLCCNVYATATV